MEWWLNILIFHRIRNIFLNVYDTKTTIICFGYQLWVKYFSKINGFRISIAFNINFCLKCVMFRMKIYWMHWKNRSEIDCKRLEVTENSFYVKTWLNIAHHNLCMTLIEYFFFHFTYSTVNYYSNFHFQTSIFNQDSSTIQLNKKFE